MRVLVYGATGLLGKALVAELRQVDPICADERDADLREPTQVRHLLQQIRPDWTVLTAAYTDVDGCESHEQLASAVNGEGPKHVATALRELGGKMLHLSTDYVFDGEATQSYEVDAPIRPTSAYGRSKAAGELNVRAILPDSCIVRTSWLFGVGGKCFPDTILKLAETRRELYVVNDQRGCPTYAGHLARALVALLHADARGTVHATNAGDCTWFELAQETLRQAGRTGTCVRPVTTDAFPRPAARPRYSVLSSASLRRWGIPMPSWQDGVADYLQARSGSMA